MARVEIYPGYFVTPDGKIFNSKGHELSQYRDKKGYCKVKLSIDGRKIGKWVHRLVATAFVPNPNENQQVNHKDENPSNNCADNLEWCTAKYNANYGGHNARVSASNKGRVISKECREKLSAAHKGKEPTWATKVAKTANSKPVSQFLNGAFIAKYSSAHEAGRQTGVHFAHISDCCRGHRNKAGGYQWRFAGEAV